MICTTCNTEIDPLEVFPGNICLKCYAKTPEANAPLTADGLAAMWRNVIN